MIETQKKVVRVLGGLSVLILIFYFFIERQNFC